MNTYVNPLNWKYLNIKNFINYEKQSIFYNFFIFLIPILNLVKINFGGELLLGELILLLLLPILILKKKGLNLDKTQVKIIIFLILWLLSQIITDLTRGTIFLDLIKGWANISLFLISFLSLILLIKTPLHIFLFFSGLIISFFYRPFNFLNEFDVAIYWKFGLGSATLLFLCLPYLWKLFKYPNNIAPLKYIIWIHFIIGTISFFINARSFAGITLLTCILLYVFYKKKGSLLKTKHISITLLLGMILISGLIKIYSEGASSGFFGKEAKEKYEMQMGNNEATVLNVLLSGRTEILVSSIAIADSPILGHGSWAKDQKYTFLYQKLRAKFKDESIQKIEKNKSNLIPTHSYLFASWVYAGFFGAIFWIVLLYILIFKVFPQSFYKASPLSIIFLIGFLNILWNIFFSPFGSGVRLEVAFYLVTYLTILKKDFFRTFK